MGEGQVDVKSQFLTYRRHIGLRLREGVLISTQQGPRTVSPLIRWSSCVRDLHQEEGKKA